MRITVCIKQVPGSGKVALDPVNNTIIRDGKQAITNPFDSYAIEEAVRLGRRLGCETVALSMGIPATERLLRDAISRGIDRAVLLTDRAFAGADTLATAYTLALGVEKAGGADLIICGKMAVDGDTAQIGPELAENLGIPHVTEVCEILSADREKITVVRTSGGGRQELLVRLPALITVTKDINMPRMPSIAGVRLAETARCDICGADDLSTDPARVGLPGSPTQVRRSFTPEGRGDVTEITGGSAGQASAIAQLIREVR